MANLVNSPQLFENADGKNVAPFDGPLRKLRTIILSE